MEINPWLFLLCCTVISGSWFVVNLPGVKILEQTSNRLNFKIRPTIFWGITIFVGGIGLMLLLGSLNITPTVNLSCDRTATELIPTVFPATIPKCEIEAALEFQEDNRAIGYGGFIISGFLFCLSLLIKALSSVITCTLDRESNNINITRQSWFQKQVTQLAVSEISDVKVEKRDNGESGWTYRVTLHLRSGLGFSLTKYYSSGFDEKQYVATLINNFLNQNFSEAKEEKA